MCTRSVIKCLYRRNIDCYKKSAITRNIIINSVLLFYYKSNILNITKKEFGYKLELLIEKVKHLIRNQQIKFNKSTQKYSANKHDKGL